MKFKGTVIGLLAAILATCIFTSYRLINEAEKQTQLQMANSAINFAIEAWTEDIAKERNKSYNSETIYSGESWNEIAYDYYQEIVWPENYKDRMEKGK